MAMLSNQICLTDNELTGINNGKFTMCHFCIHSSFFEVINRESMQKKSFMIRCLPAQEIEHSIIDCSNFERDPRLDNYDS